MRIRKLTEYDFNMYNQGVVDSVLWLWDASHRQYNKSYRKVQHVSYW